jgi:hypothetical protein
MNQAIISFLQTLDTNFFYATIQALMQRWDECLHINAGYMEIGCVPSATHEPCLYLRQKLLASEFVTLFFETSLQVRHKKDELLVTVIKRYVKYRQGSQTTAFQTGLTMNSLQHLFML